VTPDDQLPLISVIFVTYNRAHTLVATYETFLAFTDYPRDKLELVLADDASDAHTQAVLAQMQFDKRAVAPRNAGLGANQNRGMDAATGDYLLMMQDDWLLVGRRDYLRVALRALQENDDLGMILFRDRPGIPVVDERAVGSDRLFVIRPAVDEVDRMQVADGVYSDNPHLKRRGFHDIVGRFREGVPMTQMELEMSRAVARQDRYRVATIEGLEVFRHIGDRFSFNPGVHRQRRIERIERLPGGRAALALARRIVRRLRRSR
jgi:GT2 family glycosyltransferase